MSESTQSMVSPPLCRPHRRKTLPQDPSLASASSMASPVLRMLHPQAMLHPQVESFAVSSVAQSRQLEKGCVSAHGWGATLLTMPERCLGLRNNIQGSPRHCPPCSSASAYQPASCRLHSATTSRIRRRSGVGSSNARPVGIGGVPDVLTDRQVLVLLDGLLLRSRSSRGALRQD